MYDIQSFTCEARMTTIGKTGSTSGVSQTEQTSSSATIGRKPLLQFDSASRFEGVVARGNEGQSGLLVGAGEDGGRVGGANSKLDAAAYLDGQGLQTTPPVFQHPALQGHQPDARLHAAGRVLADGLQAGGDLQAVAGKAVNSLVNSGTKPSAEDLVGVVKDGITQQENDLAAFANKVKGNQELKSEIGHLRTELQDLQAHPDKLPQTMDLPVFDDSGKYLGHKSTELKTVADVQTHLNDMESRYSSLSDMNQMDQMMLQDQLQKLQQSYNTISNLSKMMHDTAKSIIGNLRA